MSFSQLGFLLPCYGIESFDLDRSPYDSEQLLSAWSALWHPCILAAVRAIPRWFSAYSPPEESAGHLIIVPDCCKSLLPEGWLSRAQATGAGVLFDLPNRHEMIAAALKLLDLPQQAIDAELAADFLALGFSHFQVEVLTRKLRYMSYLNESSLRDSALSAADAAIAGQAESARRYLQAAFDRLHEAREYFFPTEARLLDLTLLAKTTAAVDLQAELSGSLPLNVLVSGEVIQRLADREPESIERLSRALAENKAAIIGGEWAELPLPLLSLESFIVEMQRGMIAYEKHLGQRPTIFGRRRFGLTPLLPQILKRLGFSGAVHSTLDDGHFPAGNQSRIQWEGLDGTTIDALARVPLDAGRAESFLRLPAMLGDAMNLDQGSAVVFAHWPGRACRWYDDLRRTAKYGAVVGSFITIADYLQQTTYAYSGRRARYNPDEYRAPYLSQDVVAGRADPISCWVRFLHRQTTLDSTNTISAMAALCRSLLPSSNQQVVDESNSTLAAAVLDSLEAEAIECKGLDKRLEQTLQKPLDELVRMITQSAEPGERGSLVINPWSFAQQVYVSAGGEAVGSARRVEVPQMGFAWVGGGAQQPLDVKQKGWFGRRPRTPPPLAEPGVLRNEFFELRFDRHTGSIRAIFDYQGRKPRLAQQIAMRLPHGGDPADESNYSIMVADELTVTAATETVGEILSRGRLLDRDGRRLAGFRQSTRVCRGSRIIEIIVELDIEQQPDDSAWESYYALRLAWQDPSATLYRDVGLAVVPTELKRLESPRFVDILHGKQRTTLLCGGLPYHRLFDSRKLDTLLVVRGERARTFRIGLGFDVPHPLDAAIGFISPPLILPDQPRPANCSGWLFHLDCRNVLATGWSMLPGGGFRVRLLETDGQGVRAGLCCFRPPVSADKLVLSNESESLTINGDRVEIPIGSYEWTEVEVRFASSPRDDG